MFGVREKRILEERFWECKQPKWSDLEKNTKSSFKQKNEFATERYRTFRRWKTALFEVI